jgi:hypothetical protein
MMKPIVIEHALSHTAEVTKICILHADHTSVETHYALSLGLAVYCSVPSRRYVIAIGC